MYLRRRLGQGGFLIIGTLVSPVSSTIGGGPYAEIFLKVVPWPWSRRPQCKRFFTAIFLLCHAI